MYYRSKNTVKLCNHTCFFLLLRAYLTANIEITNWRKSVQHIFNQKEICASLAEEEDCIESCSLIWSTYESVKIKEATLNKSRKIHCILKHTNKDRFAIHAHSGSGFVSDFYSDTFEFMVKVNKLKTASLVRNFIHLRNSWKLETKRPRENL